MNRIFYAGCALASACLALPAAPQQADDTPEYRPPARGAPSGRIGGGTRAPVLTPPLAAVSPDHTGLTIMPQPALYYFVGKPAEVKLVLRLSGDASPLVEKVLPAPAKPGIQRLDLKTLGVRLSPGIEYRWSVGFANSREAAEVGGTIRRIEPSPELA